MQTDTKLLCKKYIWTIDKIVNCSADFTHIWDEKRTEIHDKLLEALDCDPAKLHTICSSLDVWIALDDELLSSEIEKYGNRLFRLFSSKFFKQSHEGEIREMHKKLSQLYFDDEDFRGWISSISL